MELYISLLRNFNVCFHKQTEIVLYVGRFIKTDMYNKFYHEYHKQHFCKCGVLMRY